VALEPGNEEARLGLIACLETLGSTDALDEAYAAFLSQWGDNESIRREYVTFLAKVGKWAEAADQLEFLSRESASEAVLRQLAFYRRKAGQFRSAAILYRDMLRKKPDNRVFLGTLSFAWTDGAGGPRGPLMAEANKAFKPDAESMLIEGVLRARAGDDAGALAVFRKVIDRYPKDPRGWSGSPRYPAERRRRDGGDLRAKGARARRGNRSHGSGSHSGAIWSPSGREATPLAGGTPARRKPAQAKKAPVAKKPPTTKKSSPKKAAPKKAATKAKTVKAKPAQAKKNAARKSPARKSDKRPRSYR
jgi:tetratricopeptide (TPR) repeat protein